MGTIKSSESSTLVEYLRSQRTTTQDDVDSEGAQHAPLVRYELHHNDRAAAAAH